MFTHKLKVVLLINDTETCVEPCVSCKLSKLLNKEHVEVFTAVQKFIFKKAHKNISIARSKSFFTEGHSGPSDFLVQIIDKTDINKPTERESYGIEKFNCYCPLGSNIREESNY